MNDEELHEIERRIRAWTSRPPAISPKVARTRVLARLDARRPRTAVRLATALVVAALAAGVFVFRPEKPAPPPAGEPSRLLVYVLESGTKVYLDLARPAEGKAR